MANKVGIAARISGDPQPLKQAQQQALQDTQAWVNKMVGVNSSIQKSYASLAFSGPAMRSPIQTLADADAKAWARRMADTQRHSQQWGRAMSGGSGMALLQTAQAADDLQYGLKGVLNNIPGLVMALGGGAGLAGVLSLVAVGLATVGKRFWDLWTDAKRLKEVTAWVDEMNKKLEETKRLSGKEAMEGTAEGAKSLTDAIERANEALSEQQRIISQREGRSRDLINAQAALDEAKAGGSDTDKAKAQRSVEIEQAKALHREHIAAKKAEMEAHYARSKALDEYAKKAESAAVDQRQQYENIPANANGFTRETGFNKAQAAEIDAQKARQAANKANTESIKEQGRIAEEIAHSEAVFAKELEKKWIDVDKRVLDAEQRARDKADAEKQSARDEADAAKKKEQSETAAAAAERQRELETRERELTRDIDRQSRSASIDRGDTDGRDRSRRVNARAKPARRGFGVDDIHRYQRGNSLRADMDAAIGTVGNKRAVARTDKEAHQMKVQKARDGEDPLVTELKAVKKELAEINRNTAGMSKGKSEPLKRN
jgi:hypothetical protein